MNDKRSIVRRAITSEYLSLILRFYLGILFLYASMSKIPYPAEFAEALASYQLVPYWILNFIAVYLPWVELTCGLFLIIGLSTRAASSIIALLLICFAIGQTINLIKGVPISCGCFENAGDPINWWHITKDLFWTLFAIQVFLFDKIYRIYPDLSISHLAKRH
ncbi:DoxX family protein [uncultured Desulfobacterium sp.]|uniref:DoxX family protein n=1 Tax=uncultured Desulfobacterium sp. TaxID=201089 RepID=A0A445MW37_9BACT|nr:DoxX family protein [uncultured Desulfobacterium sp.]